LNGCSTIINIHGRGFFVNRLLRKILLVDNALLKRENWLWCIVESVVKIRNREPGTLAELEALGLNTAHALVHFDNDIGFYLRTLRSFVSHVPEHLKTAKSFHEQRPPQDLGQYKVAVHSVKGSSRGIGNEKLSGMAESLEYAAKRGDTAFIEANNGLFIKAAEEFIGAAAAMLRTVEKKDDLAKVEKESPDTLLLAALKQAAESYNMAVLQEAIKSLDMYRYRSRPDFVQQLREKAGKSDFAAILDLVTIDDDPGN